MRRTLQPIPVSCNQFNVASDLFLLSQAGLGSSVLDGRARDLLLSACGEGARANPASALAAATLLCSWDFMNGRFRDVVAAARTGFDTIGALLAVQLETEGKLSWLPEAQHLSELASAACVRLGDARLIGRLGGTQSKSRRGRLAQSVVRHSGAARSRAGALGCSPSDGRQDHPGEDHPPAIVSPLDRPTLGLL